MANKTHDLDLEKLILGSILISDAKNDDIVSSMLTLDINDFYYEPSKDIIEAIKTCYGQEKAFDMVSVSSYLSDKQSKVEFEYLIEITDLSMLEASASLSNAIYKLKEYAGIREAIRLATELANGKISLDEHKTRISAINNNAVKRNYDNEKILIETYEHIINFDRKKYQEEGIKTGFDKIDRKLLINKGDFIVVSGTQSTGKTTFVLNMILNNKGKSIYLHSNDAGERSLWTRLCGIKSYQKVIDNPNLDTMSLARAAGYLKGEKITIIDKGNTTKDIFINATDIKKKHGLDLIIIDYLQRMGGKGTDQEKAARNAAELDDIAKELNVPVIAISSLSRDGAKSQRAPILADLKYSGDLEYFAKSVILLYNQFMHTEEGNPNEVQVIIAKQKDGETFKENLYFNKNILCYTESDIYGRARE